MISCNKKYNAKQLITAVDKIINGPEKIVFKKIITGIKIAVDIIVPAIPVAEI